MTNRSDNVTENGSRPRPKPHQSAGVKKAAVDGADSNLDKLESLSICVRAVIDPMWLSVAQVEAVLYALRDLVSRRLLGGQPIPREIKELYDYLRAASGDGTKGNAVAEESTRDNLIDSKEAAVILGCSARWVRRISADLDGQLCGERWVFRQEVVADYARLKGVRYEGD